MNRMYKISRIIAVIFSLAMLSTLVTGCGKMRMARHEQRADSYFAAGDFSRAEVEYRNVIRFDHTNSHAIAQLGAIYYEEGRLRQAYPIILRASQLATNDPDLHLKLGSIYQVMGKTKEACDQAGLVLDESPTNSDAPIVLADAATSPAEAEQVRRRLETVSKRIGDSAALEVAYGIMAMRTNNLTEAEAAFNRAVALDSKSSTAHYALGNLYTAQNKLKEADEAFKTSASLADVRSPRRLGYATFKMAHGELAEAKRLLEEITQAAPDYVPAWVGQAKIALGEKKYDDCTALLGRVFAHDPDNYEALLIQGRLAEVQQHPDKAAANFEHMASFYSHSAQVQYELAVARMMGHDIAGGVNSLNQALTIDPNYTDAIITLAGLNIRKRHFEPAITALTPLVRRQAQLVEPQLLLAQAYLGQTNLEQALDIYTNLEALFPKTGHFFLLAGTVLAQENKSAEAKKSVEKALELSPHFPAAVEEMVNLDIKDSQYSAAIDCVKAEETNGVAIQLLLAKIHLARAMSTAKTTAADSRLPRIANTPEEREDASQAEAELRKAIEMNPDITLSYLMLAQLYTATGKEQEALARLTALATKTNSIHVYLEMANIEAAVTNYSAEAEAYEKILAIEPSYTPILNDLAYLYSERLNQPDKAYALAEKAQRLLLPDDPSAPSAADTFGWILYKRGEYNRALDQFNQSAATLAVVPEFQLHLGMTYYMLGDDDAARASLEQAAKSPKDFPGKQEASRGLAFLAVDPKTADAKVVAELTARLQSAPNDPIAAKRLARIYERDGALEKAVKLYEEVLKVNSHNAQIMAQLAQLYLGLNDTGKALEMAKQAHLLAPDDGFNSWTLGRMVFRSGDYTWASSLLHDAAQKLPDQADVHYDLAWADYSMGRVPEAQTAMRQALPGLSATTQEDARRFLAMVAGGMSPDEALKAVDQARQILAANTNYVPAMIVLATQEEQQGKYDDARKQYEKALACYPGFSPAGRNLAILGAQYPGNDQEAFEQGSKARAAFPNDPRLAGALGVLAYRRGDYFRSAALLHSVETVNNDGQLLYYLGKAEYQLKHNQASRDALKHALNLNLASDMAADARKTLAEMK